MNKEQWITAMILLAIIMIGNIGGLLWALSW